MDIVRFKGGLGNQMFQYALLKSLFLRGRKVMGSLGFYENHPQLRPFCLTDVFRIVSFEVADERIFKEIDEQWREIKQDEKMLNSFLADYVHRFFWVEEQEFCYHPEIFETRNCTFVGYWQTEKYFDDIKDILIREFTFSYGEKQLNVLRNRLLCDGKSVSVHIRRGDYLKYLEYYGNLSESQYYNRAIEYISRELGDAHLFFFSDDMAWVKKNYGYKNAVYIDKKMFEHYEPWYDMCLMSSCSHNIIANSSFSWWGAWLNRNKSKIVIAPKEWLYNKETPDVWCDGWIKM